MPGNERRMAAVARCIRRPWFGLRGRVRVVRRRGLAHQSVKLPARPIELPVDQAEALGDEPHMRSGGFGGARRDLHDRHAQPTA